MNATTISVDVAKNVFYLAVADATWKVVESHRPTRSQFERYFSNRRVDPVVMQACGSAHHWARRLEGIGIEVRLLPAAYVRAYVRRNKTDAADAWALANKLARICFAVRRDGSAYGEPSPRPERKITRTAFAIAA